jgi:hypothetical protein
VPKLATLLVLPPCPEPALSAAEGWLKLFVLLP